MAEDLPVPQSGESGCSEGDGMEDGMEVDEGTGQESEDTGHGMSTVAPMYTGEGATATIQQYFHDLPKKQPHCVQITREEIRLQTAAAKVHRAVAEHHIVLITYPPEVTDPLFEGARQIEQDLYEYMTTGKFPGEIQRKGFHEGPNAHDTRCTVDLAVGGGEVRPVCRACLHYVLKERFACRPVANNIGDLAGRPPPQPHISTAHMLCHMPGTMPPMPGSIPHRSGSMPPMPGSMPPIPGSKTPLPREKSSIPGRKKDKTK